jgi:serine/threonine protein kinase
VSTRISPNTTIAQYTIVSKIGEGGMGEVWRARDRKLGRDVAIKVLPASLSENTDRLNRFEQEAQAAGALNHPNILVIFHIGTHEGAPYIVSELLEGETLRERMAGAALPQRKAIDYALQIARGLAAAHEKGIVHRDIKPDNVFITDDGRVKILDFGLAKLTSATDGTQSQTEVPTRKVNTDPGTVMGTMGYMSPEQLKGQDADHRSDIFSFGAILYEMLSGRRAFRGDSMAETMSAILREDPPDLSETNKTVSPALQRVVHHCLEKNPAERFHSSSDLAFAIESLSGSAMSSGQTTTVTTATDSHGIGGISRLFSNAPIAWIAAAVLLLVSLLSLPFAIAHLHRSETRDTRALKFSVAPPQNATFGTLAVSPDGRWLAFTAATAGKEQLWIRALDSLTAQVLPGTEAARYPFWSPDSRWIGFFASGKLKKTAFSGGPVQTICDAGISAGGTWSRDGVILFTTLGFGLYRVSATGADLTLLRSLDRTRREWNYNSPSFLPDDRHFLYFIQSGSQETGGVYVGTVDGPLKQRLLGANTNAVYVPSGRGDGGYLLFAREGALLAQPFDAEQLKLTGEPIPVAEHVGRDASFSRGNFCASDDGVLVYDGNVNRESKQLVWVDREGKQISPGGVGGWAQPGISPDGKRIAVDRDDKETGTRELWLYDVTGGSASRFTFDPADDTNPIWSPDGSRIVWTSNRGDTFDLYQKSSSGAGQDELLLKSTNVKVATDWSRDGRYILFYEVAPKTRRDLWVLPLFGDRKPFPFLQTGANEVGAKFSPDGQWVAYASDESGEYEVYVLSFPASAGKRQISIKGGMGPNWGRDGRELYYYAPDGTLMAVEVKSGERYEVGVPRRLFEFRAGNGLITVAPYAVSADGQRFLLNTLVDESGGAPLTIVLNWTADLKR